MLMKIVGAPLDLSQKNPDYLSTKRYRCWWAIWSLLIFVLNNICQLIMLMKRIYNSNFGMVEGSKKPGSVFVWNEYIDTVNTFVCYFGSPLFIMMFLMTKWCHVAEVFHCMEHHSFYNQQDYRRFRIAVSAGIAASIAVNQQSKYVEGIIFQSLHFH